MFVFLLYVRVIHGFINNWTLETRQELNLTEAELQFIIEWKDNPTELGVKSELVVKPNRKAKCAASIPYSVLVVSVAHHQSP